MRSFWIGSQIRCHQSWGDPPFLEGQSNFSNPTRTPCKSLCAWAQGLHWFKQPFKPFNLEILSFPDSLCETFCAYPDRSKSRHKRDFLNRLLAQFNFINNASNVRVHFYHLWSVTCLIENSICDYIITLETWKIVKLEKAILVAHLGSPLLPSEVEHRPRELLVNNFLALILWELFDLSHQ